MFKLFFGFQKRPQAKGFQPPSKRYQGPAMRLEEMRTPSGLVVNDTETTEGFVAGGDSDVEDFGFPSEESDMSEDWSGEELDPESLNFPGDGSTETTVAEEDLEDLPFLYGDIDDEPSSESDGNDITKGSDAEPQESYSEEIVEILGNSTDSFDSTDPEFDELDWIEADDSSDESIGDESELDPDDELSTETVEEAVEEEVLTAATDEIEPEVDEPDIVAQLSETDAQEDTTSDEIETLTPESDDIGAHEVEAEDSSLWAEPDEVKESESYKSFAESNNTTATETNEGVEPQADNSVGDSENEPLVTEETETNINDEGVEPQADNSIGDSESEPLVTEETETNSDEQIEDSATSDTEETTDESETEASDLVADAEFANLKPKFESGTFKVGETGQVEVDFIFDGGAYKGQVAIVSLSGMEGIDPNSQEFFLESISRAASNSELGYMVIDDNIEGARFSGRLGEPDYNSGEYQGVKSFAMRPGDEFFLILVPNGTFQQVLNNPNAGGALRPLFSLATANPNDGYHFGQIADITGDGSAFAWEDIRIDGNSDRDYNDIVLQFRGATGKAALMDAVVAPGKDWRGSDLGQAVIEYVKTYITPEPANLDAAFEDLLADLESLLDEAEGLDENFDIGTELEFEDDISLADDVAQTPIEEESIAAESETEVVSDAAETDVEEEAVAAETESDVAGDVEETDVEFEVIASESETEVTDVVETDVEFEAIAAEGETEVASDVAETDVEEELIAAEAETEVTEEIEGETEAADEVAEISLEEEAITAEDETAVGEDPEEEAIAAEDGTEVASDVEETSVEEEVIAAETQTEVASDVAETDIEFEAIAAEGETEVADEVTEIPVEQEAIAAESENSSQTPVAAEETQNIAPSFGAGDTEPVNPTSPIETRVISDTEAIATPALSPTDLAKTELISRLDNLTQTLKIQANNSQTSSVSANTALIERLENLTYNLQNQNTSRPINESTFALVSRLEEMIWQSSPALPVAAPSFSFTTANQPLAGIIDTGFSGNNPDIDYSRITWGRDHIGGDDDPTLAPGEGNEHGTHILGIIAAQRDNGIGIDGINPQAPIWAGRAVGSGKWAESLVEFVNAAVESGQPNAVVNLSLDLTQIDAEGNVTTRYEFTPMERAAIEYARQHNVMIVVAAGNDGGVMSALGQSSQEFDNIITVGAAERFNDEIALSKAYNRTEYSSYGYGLDIVAPGGTIDNPKLSLTGEGVGAMAGTSVATAKVTGAISQVWAANPSLSYRQVIEIIKNTATDLGATGFDLETGAGLLNMVAAVQLAKATSGEKHDVLATVIPDTWSGEGKVTPGERAVSHPTVRENFSGWVMPTIGVALRNSPRHEDRSGLAEPYQKTLSFDAWTYGERVTDYQLGTPDELWYRISGTNYWVPSAYIYGFPGSRPPVLAPKTTPAPQPQPQPSPNNGQNIINAVNKVNPDQWYYRPRDITGDRINETFCNWFAADVLDQLGVPIPRNGPSAGAYTKPHPIYGTNTPYKPYGTDQLLGFMNRGGDGMWERISASEAVASANNGQVVLACSVGHVAVVIPGGSGSNVLVAQAGATNGKNMSVATGFGSITPTYFRYKGTVKGSVSPNTNTSYSPPATPGQTRQYIVKSGDTLSGIALRELGNANRWREIKKANGSTFTESEARNLQVGQSVYLPVSYQVGTGTPVVSSPVSTPGTTSNINWVNFSGTVGPSIGVNLRNSPRFSDRSSFNEPNGKRLEFDAWTYGEAGTDMWTGQSDNRWFKIKGKNLWVPSCWIWGNPPNSSQTQGGSNPQPQPIPGISWIPASYSKGIRESYFGSKYSFSFPEFRTNYGYKLRNHGDLKLLKGLYLKTYADRLNLALSWKAIGWNNASELLTNYLSNNGTTKWINLDEAIRESSWVSSVVNFESNVEKLVLQARQAVQSRYRTGQIIMGFQGSGKPNFQQLLNPGNQNWFAALGNFDHSYAASFSWNSNSLSDPRSGILTVEITLRVADVYDFGPEYFPDMMLHKTGLAKNFYTFGEKTIVRHIPMRL